MQSYQSIALSYCCEQSRRSDNMQVMLDQSAEEVEKEFLNVQKECEKDRVFPMLSEIAEQEEEEN